MEDASKRCVGRSGRSANRSNGSAHGREKIHMVLHPNTQSQGGQHTQCLDMECYALEGGQESQTGVDRSLSKPVQKRRSEKRLDNDGFYRDNVPVRCSNSVLGQHGHAGITGNRHIRRLDHECAQASIVQLSGKTHGHQRNNVEGQQDCLSKHRHLSNFECQLGTQKNDAQGVTQSKCRDGRRTLAQAVSARMYLVAALLAVLCHPTCGSPVEAPTGIYTGVAGLEVLGTHNHQQITINFNGTSSVYCKGNGDTSHTLKFSWCGPLKYTMQTKGNSEVVIRLDKSWKKVPCAVRHHLTSKMRDLKLKYSQNSLDTMHMTAQVYTVWPIGWKRANWNLKRVDRMESDALMVS